MRYNEDAVRAAMPVRAQKDIERAQIQRQLDEWLAAGNTVQRVSNGESGLEHGGRKALTINEAAQRARGKS